MWPSKILWPRSETYKGHQNKTSSNSTWPRIFIQNIWTLQHHQKGFIQRFEYQIPRLFPDQNMVFLNTRLIATKFSTQITSTLTWLSSLKANPSTELEIFEVGRSLWTSTTVSFPVEELLDLAITIATTGENFDPTLAKISSLQSLCTWPFPIAYVIFEASTLALKFLPFYTYFAVEYSPSLWDWPPTSFEISHFFIRQPQVVEKSLLCLLMAKASILQLKCRPPFGLPQGWTIQWVIHKPMQRQIAGLACANGEKRKEKRTGHI